MRVNLNMTIETQRVDVDPLHGSRRREEFAVVCEGKAGKAGQQNKHTIEYFPNKERTNIPVTKTQQSNKMNARDVRKQPGSGMLDGRGNGKCLAQ